MKKILALWVLLLGLVLTAGADLPLNKVQITTQKKSGGNAEVPVSPGGETVRGAEKYTYEITVQNRTSTDLTDLTVDYIVFVERQRLAEKKGAEVVQRVRGTAKLGAVGRTPESVTTNTITLYRENLVGSYHYSDGGRIKAQDSFVGIWVRVSQGGLLIGEAAFPTTLTTRGWENEKK
jgi:hypothetical protein